MKSKLILALLAVVFINLARADFNPVALTANSYTFDIVVESNTVQALPYCINVTAGNGTGLGDNTYYEQGLYARPGQSGGNSGIPPHNTVFTNINNANMTFLMPPTYATNNELMVDSTFNSGTLYFNTPTTATSLEILSCGGGGATTLGYVVTHADSTTDTGNITLLDWFNGGGTVAWGANGRIQNNGGYNNYNSSSVNNNPPYLYANKITVSGSSPIVNVTFNYSSGQHGNIYAISGGTSGTSWTPIPVSGFNVIGTVPAAFPLTATMDQGTNTQNNGNLATWFEQGYVSNTPSAGLPPSGSTFNSFVQPTHHYQMGNYSTNNAILIDQGHLVSNITPATPANYTAFAFLTAGGNVGGTPMQDICILQHADGVNETNIFFGYDWFYNNAPGSLALKANGRVNMYNRTVNNVNNGYPYLFETYFTLTDLTSPVTNIVVKYKSASSGNATTYIMAISGSTNPVPPVITENVTPTTQAWYPTQTASFTVQVAGSAPLTNTWLVEQNGVYVPLANGVDANGSTVSGAGTTTLTISGLTLADATNYEFIAANALGSVTNTPVSISIKGRAGVVPVSGWNNIANATYTVGTSTNITSSDGLTSATLTLSDAGVNNAWSSGLTGDGANLSLLDGYIDAGNYGGIDAIAAISGLTDASYDVYIYCFPDQTRPSNGTDGLPNYTVNGISYYAPLLGATGASTYDATTNSVGGTGFNGFIPATTSTTNDFNQDIPVASFGNYIKLGSVSASGGQITIQAELDTTTFRSPLNGIELVGTSSGKTFGIHFLGNTTAPVDGPPTAPIIDSQFPAGNTTIDILTNHVVSTAFSVTIDPLSAPPLYYQWYNGATGISGATNSTYVNVDTNVATLTCIISNFVGSVTSSPVSIAFFSKPALSTYQAGIFAYNPVAYWPLNETNGNIAFDYAGTNDGIYNGNYTLNQPGIPASPGIGVTASAGFDGSTAYVEVPVGNLNIVGPMTLIEWVQPPSGGDTGFTTPIGHSDQGYRLDVAGGQPHFADAGPDVVDPNTINDGNWHLLVGVYDGTKQYLYVDGQLVGTPQGSTPSGSTGDVRIGGAPDYGNRFFTGNISQVAILTNALTSAQVVAMYNNLETPPTVSITPASPSVFAGLSVTLTAQFGGSSATHLQWYVIDNSNNSNNIAGATNSTYTIQNTTIAENGYTYGIIAANAYGTNTASVQLSVQNGPAELGGDISPLNGEAYVGAPVTYSVGAQGSLPIYYQWLLDNIPVPGATNASFTAPAQCGTHTIQVTFTNAQNGGVAIMSSVASLQGDAYPTNITFNTNGTGWQINGSVATINNNVLKLTDGNGNEASTAFYTEPQYVGSFTASFTYIGNGSADGAAFIVQNYVSGATIVGGGGGGLGYFGISNSIALELNLYSVPGIAAGTNGDTYGEGGGAIYQPTGSVDITTGDPILVQLNFANGVLGVKLTDTDTSATFSTNYVFGPLPAILDGSNLGYIGFSGGTGGAASVQTISNFEFNSVIPPVALTASQAANKSVVITWPAADPSYQLMTATNLLSPSWVAGPSPTVVGGLNQVTVQANSGPHQQFYRLVRVVCQ